MEVVAEGVETPDCLAWLRQAGCDTVQGFLFARPMPAAAFVGFVNQWRNTTMNANEPSTSCCVCCKPASNRTLVIRRRQVEAYPNLMSDAMCKLRQDRIEF
ncbi:EAL domain-containing protein [Escherichia coli]|uniref:EAL domain-containing protein n=1 Tax=Escherichia coli TaxID=562 RepID=UPI003F50E2F4